MLASAARRRPRRAPKRESWLQRWRSASLPFARSRVARRLLMLFVAAVLLPVLLVGGVAQTLLADRSAASDRRSPAEITGPLALQVQERLLFVRDIVRSWPDAAPDGGARAALPGFGRAVAAAALLDAQGRLLWQSGAGARPAAPARHGAETELMLAGPGGPARLLMVRRMADGRSWLATLDDGWLWAPLRDADAAQGWRVVNAAGRELMTHGEAPPADASEWTLALPPELGADRWTFAPSREAKVAGLFGVRFEVWVAALALASLAGVAWLVLAQIRRILVPLHHLTDVTRRLAAGDTVTRVDVGDDDEFDALAQAFNDMAAKIRSREQELSRRATRDSLTGLANRHGLQLALAGLQKSSSPRCGLFYIDLDNFKQVNDSQGHLSGDEVLRQAAQRLVAAVPPESLVARLGGDEFVVVMRATAPHEIQRYALRCRESLAQAFWLDGVEHLLGGSVGVALAPDHGTDLETLLRRADIAMYSVKRTGRNGHAVFKPEMDQQARDRVQLLRELRHALERREFLLHFQPRVNPEDGRVTSAEALLRWKHPERGLLMPGTFISVAEESDLIEALGNWVLEEGCAQLARWQREGVQLARLSVNVSPRQLGNGKLPGIVRECLNRYRVPPTALELEVTESLLVGDVTRSAEQLAEIRGWGVSIALDDFGTGYSSLASLRQLPIDVIKIDRAFVRDLGHDESALAVVRTILTLADALKLHTVAEGIETALQAKELRELGCDEFQGYLYHKPMSVGAFSLLDGVRSENALV